MNLVFQLGWFWEIRNTYEPWSQFGYGSMQIAVSLAGSNLITLLNQIREQGLLGSRLPSSLEVDFKSCEITSDWLSRYVLTCQKELMVRWTEPPEQFLAYYPDSRIKLRTPSQKNPNQLLELLSQLTFEIAAFDTVYDEWYAIDEDYIAPSFANGHYPHGWACALKGVGHQHLVSRRWLDFGPWHLLKGPQDTTLVQFHDLAADATTALAQAKPGHLRMGISDIGGFIQSNYLYEHGIKGQYDVNQRLLKIVVHGREISQLEMLDMCAARYYQALGNDQPLERIGYVFMQEEEAQRYLHELWLRELECWAIIDGQEIRLDKDYHPLPNPPSWVIESHR